MPKWLKEFLDKEIAILTAYNEEDRLQLNKQSYFITCAVCGNKEVLAYYSDKYNGYLAECDVCDDQWKIT